MQLGFVGLGKMGGNMVHRIHRDSDHEAVVFDFRGAVPKAGSSVPRFAVLGPPGSGKTTLEQVLAYRAATGHDLPEHLIQLLSDGQAIDCRRLEEASGWRPRESTADVAVKFAAPPVFQKAG